METPSRENSGLNSVELPPKSGEAAPNDFVALFLPERRALFEYILALLPNPIDAEDVLQETSMLLWQRFDEFSPGTSFLAWARRVAYFKVCEHRRAKGRQINLLDDDILESVAAIVGTDDGRAELRRNALRQCVQKLPRRDRSILEHRYLSRTSIKEVAQELGRSADSVYKSLGRIRRTLLECIRRNVARAEREENAS